MTNRETEKLPPCKCGHTQWIEGGARLAPGFQTWGYTCKHCGRHACLMTDRGGNLFLVGGGAAIDEWLAGPVEATWADHAAKIQAARDEHQAKAKARVVAKVGFDPDHMTKMSDEQHKAWTAAWDAEDREDPFIIPEALQNAPMLPGAPCGLHGFIERRGVWMAIDPLVSIAMPVPPHPRRVRTQEVFYRLFASLNRSTGKVIEPEEVANEYSKDRHQPWYRFTVEGKTFTVGARKRVLELRCDVEDPRIVAAWEELSKRDQVTFSASPLLIHAWGTDRMGEYLAVALNGETR